MKVIVEKIRLAIMFPILVVIAAYHIYVKGEMKDE